jgi:6-pyruvoyl-tetrahydropterin synthase
MTKEMINDLVNTIKDEIYDFYDVTVNDEVVVDFIEWYYLNEDNEEFKPFDDEGIPVFDTSEREDFMYYLEDLGIVKLK